MRGSTVMATVLATLLFAGAVVVCGALLDGYGQSVHPVALLGAQGIDRAAVFNVVGFVASGLLMAWAAWRLREQLREASAIARIGAWMWLLSALAFAAQGVLPLDPTDLTAEPSRLHATAWTLWWVAFVPGALLLAAGRGVPAGPWRLAVVVAAVLVPVCAALPLPGMSPAIVQRVAFAAWFGALLVAAQGLSARGQR